MKNERANKGGIEIPLEELEEFRKSRFTHEDPDKLIDRRT